MTTLPRIRRVLSAATATLVATLLLSAPVGAFEKEPVLTIGEGQTIEEEYTAAPVGAGGEETNPDFCASRPDCDVVPLKVVVPDRLKSADTTEDFFVRVTMTWPMDVEGPIGTSENDMDMSIWDDPPGDEEIASGASSANPERASLVNPRKGSYSIVVVNFTGANRGYTLQAEWVSGAIPTPYESLEERKGPKGGGGEEEFVPPEDLSGLPVDESTSGSGPIEPAPEPVASTPIAGDDAFAFSLPRAPALKPSVGSDDAGSLFDARPVVGLTAADPVPVAVVLFWLLVVPGALVGAGFLWMRHRRPVALAVN